MEIEGCWSTTNKRIYWFITLSIIIWQYCGILIQNYGGGEGPWVDEFNKHIYFNYFFRSVLPLSILWFAFYLKDKNIVASIGAAIICFIPAFLFYSQASLAPTPITRVITLFIFSMAFGGYSIYTKAHKTTVIGMFFIGLLFTASATFSNYELANLWKWLTAGYLDREWFTYNINIGTDSHSRYLYFWTFCIIIKYLTLFIGYNLLQNYSKLINSGISLNTIILDSSPIKKWEFSILTILFRFFLIVAGMELFKVLIENPTLNLSLSLTLFQRLIFIILVAIIFRNLQLQLWEQQGYAPGQLFLWFNMPFIGLIGWIIILLRPHNKKNIDTNKASEDTSDTSMITTHRQFKNNEDNKNIKIVMLFVVLLFPFLTIVVFGKIGQSSDDVITFIASLLTTFVIWLLFTTNKHSLYVILVSVSLILIATSFYTNTILLYLLTSLPIIYFIVTYPVFHFNEIKFVRSKPRSETL